MAATPELESDRVLLRGVRPQDVDRGYLQWMNDPVVTRQLESRFEPPDRESLLAYVAAAAADPNAYFFAIVLRSGSRYVGNIKLGPIDRRHGTADVGLLLGERDVWSEGLATESIRLLTAWAFPALNLRKVTAGAYATNGGSIRAFERAGFVIEGVRRSHYVSSDGTPVDGVLLARFAPSAANEVP